MVKAQESHYGSTTHGGKGAPSQHLTQSEKEQNKRDRQLLGEVGRWAVYFEKLDQANPATNEARHCLIRLHATGLRWLLGTKPAPEALEKAAEATKAAKTAENAEGLGELLATHAELFKQLGMNEATVEKLTRVEEATALCCPPGTAREGPAQEPCKLCPAQAGRSRASTQAGPSEADEEGPVQVLNATRGHRLVNNHSTWADGLRPLVKELAGDFAFDQAVLTFCPGKLSTDSASYAQVGRLDPQETRGQTLFFAWRKGKQVQELTVTVKGGGDVKDVQHKILRIACATTTRRPGAGKQQGKLAKLTSIEAAPRNEKLERQRQFSEINKRMLMAEYRQNLERKLAKAKMDKEKGRIKQLLTASGNRGDVDKRNAREYAIRDEQIVSGECRSKYSMRG